MKKTILIAFMIIFVLAGALLWSKGLESGETMIFLKNGQKIKGEIEDISSRRLVLELKDGTKVDLSKIWMINFIDKKWDFPKEVAKIVKSEHYFFLKNDDIISGELVDYSVTRGVFELESGEKVKFGSIKRIYFTKKVPDAFKVKEPTKVRIKREIKK